MGYREAFDVLAGRATLEDAVERDIGRTRAYAKRQRTWFRAEPQIRWLDAGTDPLPAALAITRAFLDAGSET
jgi:tRNA dimethylallyltransferase